jgi:hypothetical protein
MGREPSLTWQTTLLVECPYCGNNDLAISHATELAVLSPRHFEIRAIGGDNEPEIGAEDAISGLCRSCGKSFAIELIPRWKSQLPSALVFVQFSPTGFPQSISAGDIEGSDIRVFDFRPIAPTEEDPLLSAPPLGVFSLYMKVGEVSALCQLAVRPTQILTEGELISWNFEEMSCWLSSTNDTALIEQMQRALTDLHVQQFEKAATAGQTEPFQLGFGQPVPESILRRAAFVLIAKSEIHCRDSVWQHLRDVYDVDNTDPKWWQARGLPKRVADYIRETANKDGDRAFSHHSPVEYVSIGHIREILKEQWTHFKEYLPRQERVLFTIQKFEDIRNAVAHFRRITPIMYRNIRETSSELLDFFAPLVESKTE